jgi:adenosylhomocysteine nucleosidase
LTLNVVGVVCALASEARHVRPSDAVRVALSGMGGAAAAQSAHSLIEAGAQALVSWGMAGGLDPALRPGTIFLPSEVASPDGTSVLSTEASWSEALGAAIATHQPLLQGRLLTTPKAVGTQADKSALFKQTGAVAVDMESLAIAQVAHSQQVPFIAIRVIVDSAADTLPRAVTAAADSEGQLQIGRLLGALARTPAEIPALLRLGGRYRAANRSLAAVGRVGLFGGVR